LEIRLKQIYEKRETSSSNQFTNSLHKRIYSVPHMTQFPATCSMRIRIWSNIYSKWGWWECYSYNLCIKAEAEWKVLCINNKKN